MAHTNRPRSAATHRQKTGYDRQDTDFLRFIFFPRLLLRWQRSCSNQVQNPRSCRCLPGTPRHPRDTSNKDETQNQAGDVHQINLHALKRLLAPSLPVVMWRAITLAKSLPCMAFRCPFFPMCRFEGIAVWNLLLLDAAIARKQIITEERIQLLLIII